MIKSKYLISIVFIIILSTISSAWESENLIKADNLWKIEKNDNLENNINFEFLIINSTTILIKWQNKDNFLFNALKNCQIGDSDCINTIAHNNGSGAKDYIINTKPILGFIENKYSSSDLIDSYNLNSYYITQNYIDDIILKGDKYYSDSSSINIHGDINPFINNTGELYIEFAETIYKPTYFQLQIGEHTFITTFNNSVLSILFNYTDSTTKTAYIEVPRYANIHNATLNISGTGYYEWWYQERANSNITSPLCTVNNTGVYGSDWGDIPAAHDDDWNTAQCVPYPPPPYGTGVKSYINYTIPPNILSAKLRYKFVNTAGTNEGEGNVTVNAGCLDNGDSKLNLYLYAWSFMDASAYAIYYCWNGGDWDILASYSESHININGHAPCISDEAISWIYYSNLTNLTMDVGQIGDTKEYNNASQFVGNATIDFTTGLKGVITDNCNCSKCSYTEFYCYLPVSFSSLTGGQLLVSDLHINATYAILNITIRDENTNLLINDRNVSLIFNSITKSFNKTTSTGYLSVDWSDFETYSILYYAIGYPVRNRIFNYDGQNNPAITLYLANYSTTVPIKFTVADQYRALLPNAIIKIYRYDLYSNSFINIMDDTTDVNGQTYFSMVPNNVKYRYLIFYDNIMVYNETNPYGELIYESDTEKNFIVYVGVDTNLLQTYINSIGDTLWLETREGNTSGNISYYYESIYNLTVCMGVLNDGIINCNAATSSGYIYYKFENQTESRIFDVDRYISYNSIYFPIANTEYVYLNINMTQSPFKRNGYNIEGFIITLFAILLMVLTINKYPEIVVLTAGLTISILMATNIIYINQSYKNIVISSVIFLTVIFAGLIYQAGKRI